MVRVGIAGTGFIGGVHARSARLAGGHLVGVAASSPERSRRAADALGADRAFESAEALATAEDVDVVHICTPNHLHAPLAELALAAGKHVICEKPLAMDAAQARRLTDAARDAPGQAAVPFVYRYYPTVREARERVRRGETGAAAPDPRHVPAGLAAPPRGRQLARRRGHRRRVPGVRRHRLALVRPRRVRRRPAHHAGLRAPDHRRARPRARRGPRGVRAGRRHGRAPQRRDRGRRRRAVRDRRRRAGRDRDQPDLRRAQEPPVARARRRGGVARVRPGVAGVALGRPARARHARQARPGLPLGARGAPGHAPRRVIRRATRTASTPSWRTSTPRSRAASRPRACRCSPTASARRRSPMPC